MSRLFRAVALAALALIALPCLALGLDTVRTLKGTTVNGNLTQTSARSVVIKQTNGNEQTIPVDEIESIKFNAEPPQLNVARTAAQGGRYDEALRTVEKLMQDNKGTDRPEIQQDLQYLQALCTARLALVGRGDLLAAGKLVREFTQKNPNSYRTLEATELLGDIFVAIDKPDLAQQQYAAAQRLASSNLVRMRSLIAQGNVLLAQGEWEKAASAFDEVLSIAGNDNSDATQRQRQLARLGKAVCLAASDKPADGIALAQQVIAEIDPEVQDVAARAYNALGTCFRRADRPKDALLAFLHVDLLYPAEAMQHAEALKNLAELWPEVGNSQRAAEAEEVLRTRYANTRWAKG
jgi:tetratricopeptide (TPR) repeat protein